VTKQSNIISIAQARQISLQTNEIYALQTVNEYGSVLAMVLLDAPKFPNEKLCFNDTFIVIYKINKRYTFNNFIKRYYKKLPTEYYNETDE
jgi:hypothetical protein